MNHHARWEYKTLYFRLDDVDSLQIAADALDEAGGLGWELVHVIHTSLTGPTGLSDRGQKLKHYTVFFMKRGVT